MGLRMDRPSHLLLGWEPSCKIYGQCPQSGALTYPRNWAVLPASNFLGTAGGWGWWLVEPWVLASLRGGHSCRPGARWPD